MRLRVCVWERSSGWIGRLMDERMGGCINAWINETLTDKRFVFIREKATFQMKINPLVFKLMKNFLWYEIA